MEAEVFKQLLDELDGNSLQTLKEKNARYSQNGDCLHNFRSGAEIVGGTPAQACWGYLTKHLVALRDMINKDDFSNREDFLEKCQDTINYIRFLWCIGNDGNEPECKEADSTSTNVFHLEPMLYPTLAGAEYILVQIRRFVHEFGQITVAEYGELVGKSYGPNSTEYGWKTVEGMDIRKVAYIDDGYIINLPAPQKL